MKFKGLATSSTVEITMNFFFFIMTSFLSHIITLVEFILNQILEKKLKLAKEVGNQGTLILLGFIIFPL
ncbi:MAG: hypothetical protein B6D55_07765 [Candidatus Omnitrophica bacterium 4484_70.2]|nr:MAG: hypothetical protein B6D55_07765 [Candidatus Omnitrophica bacterium 4484_70.2]